MITFLVALVALIVGFVLYGTFVEKVFGIDEKAATPAITKNDGVDFVPMSGWRVFLVQFLNIAGLGPIFGAIMGIFFGPSAFLWIVFGTIFGGGVHDYLSGMLSLRKGGVSLPEIVGSELGTGVRVFMRVLSLVLLLLLTTTFLSGPATLLQGLAPLSTMPFHGRALPIVWVLIIFGYYALATVLPVDKLIGRFYPIFGAMLLFMGVGIAIVMLGWHGSEMPELTDGLYNRKADGLPTFPMMFVSIACGAISGFHGTQSPIMSRCLTNERQGRLIFYGAMETEEAARSPPTMSRKASPSMGTSTIRNENSATLLRDAPLRSPDDMVVPERESPGITATAWPRPITSACPKVISFPSVTPDLPSVSPDLPSVTLSLPKGLALSDRNSSNAVTIRAQPTTSSELKSSSTLSLKKKPTMATGIIDTTSLAMKSVCSLYLNLNRPWRRSSICLRNTTIVARAVATCTVISKARSLGASAPRSSRNITRCPLLLTGRNSVSPCTKPRIKACHQFIISSC